jgi:uncharacterized membrane protein
MFDALSFAEIDGQHAELLPARAVMSLFAVGHDGGGARCVQQALVGLQGTNILSGLNVGVLGPILGSQSNSVSAC